MKEATLNLHKLRKRAENINASLLDDLKPFFTPDNLVFRRLPDSDTVGNVTTTCSCLMSMVTSDQLVDFFRLEPSFADNDEAQKRITKVFENAVKQEWKSSGLEDNNAFSSFIVLRTAGLLLKHDSVVLIKPPLEMEHNKDTLRKIAKRFASGAPKSFEVAEYPSKTAIAYWFVEAVENLKITLRPREWISIASWVSQVFARGLSLVTSQHDAMMDPVEMAMAACLATRLRRIAAREGLSNRDEIIQSLPTKVEAEHAILKAFTFQGKSGIWPKYFPLFNYRQGGVGSNYFFTFELLEVVVHEFDKSDLLEDKVILKGIERALTWCENNRLTYRYGDKIYRGWNSGGQITTLIVGKPESWATAVVHMFLCKLCSAVSILIERQTLAKYGATRPDIVKKDPDKWDNFVDSPLPIPGVGQKTVKQLIQTEILNPIENHNIGHGKLKQQRRSALLFGPPGTSKTTLVRAIAKKLGWPLVELNPSDLLREGLENIYSQADRIFDDLKELSNTVVFFDEMDALAQKREEGIDVTRQFLTTSMLPKLSMLHDEGRVLFFMATNHQRHFDEAIKRPGRFDLLICMAPSLWIEKLNNLEKYWSGTKENGDVEFVRKRLEKWVPSSDKLAQILDLFTFNELQGFLEQIRDKETLRKAIARSNEKSFRNKVQEWGDNYIALRPQTLKAKPKGDLSIRDEFDEDKQASRIQ